MNIVSRSTWQAQPSRWAHTPQAIDDVEDIFAHWNGTPIYLNGPGLPRAIQRYHLGQSTRNNDILYSFLIDQNGVVYEGRGFDYRDGATDRSVAGKSLSIYMNVGKGQKLPVVMLKAFVQLVIEIRRRSNRAFIPVRPHRDARATTCPGDEIDNWIKRGMPLASDKPVVKPSDLADIITLPPLGKALLTPDSRINWLPWRKARIHAMQRALGRLGYGLVGTGPWGPKTTRALHAFQLKELGSTGPVGPKTWAALEHALIVA